ncbi:hypothetical protein TWF788_007961 [Orbilia oligospora]|uniref:Extracellular membrane protein CFEM domain-containing protein n=1 Tax=Orbilia oligospora TaxID=2813651 RepID=A0A6G1MER1_ORBOL|nr:hypothetical protein TWF788_007961 [Orbilia oligospora]KAF3217142.1 hypothetical protein TWF191_008823 [Orbilia oligospora]KAF3222405.1 hypothetical protein TWF679_005883 [Orbilia oligospora]KAF3253526.1 hypothetical protein TWF192_003777 [Orbilia oligospora]
MQIKIAILSVLITGAAARTPFPQTSRTTSTTRYPGRCSPATIIKIVSQKCPISHITKTVTHTTTVTKVVDPGPQTEEVEVEEEPTPSTTSTTKIGPQTPELPKCPPSTTVRAFRTCLQNAPPCPTERRCINMKFNLTHDCTCIGAAKQVTTTVFNTVCKGDCGCTPTITWTAKGPCVTAPAPKDEKPGGKGGEEGVGETVAPPQEEEIDDVEGGY